MSLCEARQQNPYPAPGPASLRPKEGLGSLNFMKAPVLTGH